MKTLRGQFIAVRVAVLTAVAASALPVQAWAADEDLLFAEIPMVYSASRRDEPIMQSTAAVFVITQEDIRRTGVTSIPEALRLAPGLDVARADAHTWNIGVRGFNGLFSNKLLVLMDGRSVYTPLFSGVFWDVQDTALEDIERIEIIRGPGATMWGANAVNGVINIITKKAGDTQGALVSGGGGTEEQGFGTVRYGGKAGENLYFRVYGKALTRDDFVLSGSGSAQDGWQMSRGGVRVDSEPSATDRFTFQGDAYAGQLGQITAVSALTPPYNYTVLQDTKVSGGNVLGRWSHTLADDADLQLQMYYDQTTRDTAIIGEDRDTFDLDFQHRFHLAHRQNIMWGLGYRLTRDDIRNTFTAALDPSSRATHVVSGFVQDEIALAPDRLRLTLGSKFEHNDFTGFEIQPGGRLLWTPNRQNSVWAGVSRAVRTPSRTDSDVSYNALVIPGAPTTVIRNVGNPDREAETVVAYELGYRVEPRSWVSLDVAMFYNVYDNLYSAEPGTPFFEVSPAPAHVVVPIVTGNKLFGEAYGAEVAAHWQVLPRWRLQAQYTWLSMQLHTRPSSGDTVTESDEGNNPQQQFGLQSYMDLPGHLEWDCVARYVDRLPNQNVPGYVSLDVRLGWRPNANWELSIVGQNLLDDRHPEFGTSFIGQPTTEMQRSVYGKVTWRF